MLERSGIGAGARLKALGVEVVRDLPGVGENLQDHLQLRPMFKVSGVPTMNAHYASIWRRPLMALQYALLRRGPMTMAPSQMGAFAKSSPNYATANLEFHVQPLSLGKFGEALHRDPAITISVCNLRPTSRGSVHARSADPDAKPMIQPNYLSTPEDERVAIDSLRLVRRIAAQPPLARYHATEFLPGPEKTSDEALAGGGAGDRHHHLPPGRYGEDGRGERSDGGGGRAAAGARRRGAARRGCVGHADHYVGQHQFPHHDDRGKSGADDPGGSALAIQLRERR